MIRETGLWSLALTGAATLALLAGCATNDENGSMSGETRVTAGDARYDYQENAYGAIPRQRGGMQQPAGTTGEMRVTKADPADDDAQSAYETRVTSAPPRPSGSCNTLPSGPDRVHVSMAYPTGDPRTSAVCVEKSSPRQVIAGQPFEYEIAVTNLSSLDLSNVVVRDQMSPGFTVESANPPMASRDGGVAMWEIPAMAPGETRVMRVMGVAGSEGAITACATVTYDAALCTEIMVVKPALQLTKAGPAEALVCDELTLTYTVTNSGSGAAADVVINDALPDGWTTTDGRNDFSVNVGTIAAGQSRTFSVKVKPNATGEFRSGAKATGAAGLTASSENLRTVVRQPALAVTMESPDERFIGRDAEFTVRVRNTGNATAENAVVEATMPAGARFVSASDNGRLAGDRITWSVGAIPADATRTLTFTVATAAPGTLNSTAVARAVCAADANGRAQTVYKGIPAILLEVVDVTDPVEVGQQTTFIITATNQGSAPGTNVAISLDFEEIMEFVSAGGATAGTNRARDVIFAPLARLDVGAQAQWRVTLRATAPGDHRIDVRMTSDQLTRPVTETEATNLYR